MPAMPAQRRLPAPGGRLRGRRLPGRLAGVSIRRLLLTVVVVPVAGVLVLASVVVRASTASAVDASRVASLVHTAMRVDAARAAVQQEVLPDMGLTVMEQPRLRARLGIAGMQVPITPGAVAIFGSMSDKALQDLPAHRARADVPALRRQLVRLRTSIASGRNLQASYQDAEALVDRIAGIENRLLDEAAALQPDSTTAHAVADVRLLAQASQRASQEAPLFFQIALNGLAPTADSPNRDPWTWQQAHHQFQALSALVGLDTAAPVARAWQAADRGTDATVLRRTLDRAEAHGIPRDQDLVAKLFVADNGRNLAFGKVLHSAADRAVAAAGAHRTASLRDLDLLAGLGLTVAALSLLTVLLVRRALTRPLERLAAQATRVGLGELDDVPESGPREVRTVARGLSAAVATLRKIQEQTAAVTTGDLQSPVLRRPLPGALGAVVHRSVTQMVESIRERHQLQDDLAHQAAHDALTGLPNRAHALRLLADIVAGPGAEPASTALLFVDLDHFKQANDTFGHATGDQVLREVATRLSGAVRAGDTVARLGGDEFLVVLRDIADESGHRDAVALAERLVTLVSEPVLVEDCQVLVGASVGVAFGDETSRDPGRLLVEADAAAYRAKSGGRNRVEVYDEQLRAELAARDELGLAIAAGLERGEFLMHYQPIVELATGRELGFEALIRWERPGHGLVPPDRFIPVAEASPLINDLGRWVLHEATGQLMAWSRSDPALADQVVAVNLSGRHLLSRRVVDDVRDALEASGLEPGRLTVEVTETVLVDDRHAVLNMAALRELGVRIAIDDFGTGYTSIGQLHKLPVDSLKIDRSFVGSADPAHAELVRLMVGAAHAYDLEVVAEGVESPQQAAALRTIDVDLAQGFLFARPVPASAIPPRWQEAG